MNVEPPFQRDHNYENSSGVREVLEALDQGERAVMVVGRAGTGKTTLIHYLRRRPGGERQVILAPTGIAALNAGGQWDDEEQRIISKVIGSYTQVPLIPAWAITINKAQGLTLDDVQVDLDSGAFAPGQTYVALSRARSFEGLSLVRPIRPADVRVAPDLIKFGKWLQPAVSPQEPTALQPQAST